MSDLDPEDLGPSFVRDANEGLYYTLGRDGRVASFGRRDPPTEVRVESDRLVLTELTGSVSGWARDIAQRLSIGSSGGLHCSFCGKSQREVRKLIAGPSVYICDECVSLCQDIISGTPEPP